MTDAPDELTQLKAQAREDRKLIDRAAQALAEISRGPGISDEHADVLAALRIRLEGKPRASLEELMTVTEDMPGKDLGDVLGSADKPSGGTEWPTPPDDKKEWPGL
jgi:hypothetical protein